MIGYHQPYVQQHAQMQFGAAPPNQAQFMQPAAAFYQRALSDPSKSVPSQTMNEAANFYQIPVSQAAQFAARPPLQVQAQSNQYSQFQSSPMPQRFSVPASYGGPIVYTTPINQQQQPQQQQQQQKQNIGVVKPQVKAPVIDKSVNGRKGQRKHRRSLSNGALPIKKED